MISKGSKKEKRVYPALKLPPDVEMVVRDFHYLSNEGNVMVEIKGERLVRRGTRFLHVRSNVFKKNYLRNVCGRIVGKDGNEIVFTAERAELGEGEILLKQKVELRKGGRVFNSREARIDLKAGVLVGIDADNIKPHQLKGGKP